MPGFDFSNHDRNAALHANGVPLPKATSTGTTIVGCLYDEGVVVRTSRHRHLSLSPAEPPASLFVQSALLVQAISSFPKLLLKKLNHMTPSSDPATSHRSNHLRLPPTPAPHPAPLSPTRTAKSYIISPRKYGALEPVLLQTRNSPQRSSPPTSSYTPSPPAGSPAS